MHGVCGWRDTCVLAAACPGYSVPGCQDVVCCAPVFLYVRGHCVSGCTVGLDTSLLVSLCVHTPVVSLCPCVALCLVAVWVPVLGVS